MPAKLDVDREQVRMLVMTVGCTEAAKQTGIKLATVLQWSARGKWLAPAEPKQLPPTMTPQAVIGVIKPADALANTLADDSKASRVAALKYSRRTLEHAAKVAEEQPGIALAMSSDVLSSVKVAASAGSWEGTGGNSMTVNLLIQ